ncbi:hypothetical protein OOZ19_08225 [Saccharopolyspora sp. NFXS83]|uniref:hypothetical protein n=1 Tax=Saccharopolyspora sp. NFXS83 TaxID=2993560 RepID=UPI00224AC6B8|nr:hypothetical protein [Saccharopolyspora sp. NFXS83]MCX2730226.1 hypothetical protein [Saccharopolyspora sp. NFXS83]
MEPAERDRADALDSPSGSVHTLMPEAAIPAQHRQPWPCDLEEADESHLIRGYD